MTPLLPSRRLIRTRCLALSTLLLCGTAQVMAASPVTDTPAGSVVKMMKKPMMAGADIHNRQACSTNGVALAGIDVVSYHMATGPLIGSPEFSREHAGLTYRFLSQQHADLFVASPEKYLPSYLGWCATSLAIGALTCPNPLNYKLENGQLLLFETTGFTNGQDLWNADPLDYRRRADRNQDGFLQSNGATDEDPLAAPGR